MLEAEEDTDLQRKEVPLMRFRLRANIVQEALRITLQEANNKEVVFIRVHYSICSEGCSRFEGFGLAARR